MGDFYSDHFKSEALSWVKAEEESTFAEIAFERLLTGGYGNEDQQHSDPILPGRDLDSVNYDLCDWDGISLEFSGYIGEPPSLEERKRIYALGFNVIRIDYKDVKLHTNQHKIHGDWWSVAEWTNSNTGEHHPERVCQGEKLE